MRVLIFAVFGYLSSAMAVRRTERITLPPASIGTRGELVVHHYGPSHGAAEEEGDIPRCYIQASLHADELPGMLVCHHLIKLLDAAELRGEIVHRVCVVPYANPLGLSQTVLGSHLGRFSTTTGINFNRNWLDVSDSLAEKLTEGGGGGGLSDSDPSHNIRLIRRAILAELDTKKTTTAEIEMKRRLLCLAATSDVVLDLHCDNEALMHMYTHTKLWPQMADLAAEIQSECHLTASTSGGHPFDEVASHVWSALQDRFPRCPIPMACQSVTVELRGESDVSDELAIQDAAALYRFLQRRGFIRGAEKLTQPPPLKRQASPLTAVDMIDAQVPGVIAWKVPLGAYVQAGQLLAEIVSIEDPDAPRVAVTSRQAGIVFGRRRHALAIPGQTIIKVAGEEELGWRKGNLLTS